MGTGNFGQDADYVSDLYQYDPNLGISLLTSACVDSVQPLKELRIPEFVAHIVIW